MANNNAEHFSFGKNWENYVKKHFSEERVQISKQHLLDFLGLPDLRGKTFLDIGCGSGLHSLAALQAGAEKIISFDYDINSVSTTQKLQAYSGNPKHWVVLHGSILDLDFVNSLEPADIVYAWGVLHHTGDMWKAIENTSLLIKQNGYLYLALYTANIIPPSDQFWLDVKQKYNKANQFTKRKMELWYIWEFMLGKNLLNIPQLIKTHFTYKHSRGMALYTDIVDWLGGWPMEFADIEDVKKFCTEKLNLSLVKIKTGQSNTEYCFTKP